jgi:hypothetical protein
MPEFKVAKLRLQRAKTYGAELADMWNALSDQHLCELKVRAIPIDGYGELHVFKANPVPDEFALRMGEMLYQLRSSLDSCIYQATVYHTQKDPPDKETSLEFPITADAAEFAKLAKRRLWGLPQDVVDGIEKAQPFNLSKTLSQQDQIITVNRSLEFLNDLARIDRHRKLHVVGSVPVSIKPSLILPDGVTLKELKVNIGELLQPGAVLASFRLEGFKSGMSVQFSAGMATSIACANIAPPICVEDTFSARLNAIHNSVATIVSAFQTYKF